MTTFAPWDGEWWASNIPSIGSTLALAVPAVGTVGLVSRFGKALNIAQKIGANTGRFAQRHQLCYNLQAYREYDGVQRGL